jgi:hypothetical protein
MSAIGTRLSESHQTNHHNLAAILRWFSHAKKGPVACARPKFNVCRVSGLGMGSGNGRNAEGFRASAARTVLTRRLRLTFAVHGLQKQTAACGTCVCLVAGGRFALQLRNFLNQSDWWLLIVQVIISNCYFSHMPNLISKSSDSLDWSECTRAYARDCSLSCPRLCFDRLCNAMGYLASSIPEGHG